jgi:hypothetical protein
MLHAVIAAAAHPFTNPLCGIDAAIGHSGQLGLLAVLKSLYVGLRNGASADESKLELFATVPNM